MMHEISEERRSHVQACLHKLQATAFLQLKSLSPTLELVEVYTIYMSPRQLQLLKQHTDLHKTCYERYLTADQPNILE